MQLTPVMEKYVLHWGEMGTRWGVNRTVAQIHALLSLSPEPLHAEEIAETLAVARSNVSTSLKELQSWKLIQVSHVIGDRRDRFSVNGDTWQIEPTLTMLRNCVLELEEDTETPKAVKARINAMLDFVSTLSTWFDEMIRLPKRTLVTLMKLGSKVQKIIPRPKPR